MSSKSYINSGKVYIPGLGSYFKISLDEIDYDNLQTSLMKSIEKYLKDNLKDMVEDNIGEITSLEDYLKKEEAEQIHLAINDAIELLKERLNIVETTNVTQQDVSNMINASLENYYNKSEVDNITDNIVEEFTDEEVLRFWYAAFPQK